MSEKEFAASEKAGSHQQRENVRLKIEPLDDPTILDQVLHITVEGPVVSTTLPQLAEPLLAAILGSDRPVLLDLRGVPDIDSEGLSLLLKLHKTMPAEFHP